MLRQSSIIFFFLVFENSDFWWFSGVCNSDETFDLLKTTFPQINLGVVILMRLVDVNILKQNCFFDSFVTSMKFFVMTKTTLDLFAENLILALFLRFFKENLSIFGTRIRRWNFFIEFFMFFGKLPIDIFESKNLKKCNFWHLVPISKSKKSPKLVKMWNF